MTTPIFQSLNNLIQENEHGNSRINHTSPNAYEANSKYGDPLFVSATDYHLRSGSPAIQMTKCVDSVWNGVANVTDFDGRRITDAAGVCVVSWVPAGAYYRLSKPFF
jgi:hypothetical protein